MSSTTTDPGNRSSAEIEREVESTRARLTGTLEELRDRASPGQLFEQAVDYMRNSGGAEFARNLGNAVRDNPLPLLLIGTGIGWLMLSGNRSGGDGSGRSYETGGGPYRALPPPSRERPMARFYGEAGGLHGSGTEAHSGSGSGASSGGPSMADRAAGALGDARDRVGDAASGVREGVTGAAQRAGDMASSAYESVSGAAGSAARRVGDMASSAYESVTDAAGNLTGRASSAMRRAQSSGYYRVRDGASYVGDSAREGLGWVVRDQPLVLGAIGLALGAAVGALLPGTRTEDRLMGETRDDLAERATAMAQQGYEQVKEAAGEQLDHAKAVAGEVYENTKERLDQGGFSVSRAGEALGAAARDAREAVRDAAQDAREAVRNTAQEAGNQVRTGIGSSDDASRPSTEARPSTDKPSTEARPGMPPRTGTADPVTSPQPSPRQSNPL